MALHEVFSRMLIPRNVRTVFQPIIALSGGAIALHSVECLTRTPLDVSHVSPQDLFDHARTVGAESLLDRSCAVAALRAASKLPGEFRVSLNVHASTLASDADLPVFIAERSAECGISLTRLTLEIVEHSPPHGVKAFRTALAKLRAFGMLIAIDDIGLGYSNFRMIVDAQADYFKIDRYFVSGIERDPYRFAVLESVAKLALKVDARVVAEGVETASELALVLEAGIDLVQGFYFSEPLTPERFQEHPMLKGLSAPHSLRGAARSHAKVLAQ